MAVAETKPGAQLTDCSVARVKRSTSRCSFSGSTVKTLIRTTISGGRDFGHDDTPGPNQLMVTDIRFHHTESPWIEYWRRPSLQSAGQSGPNLFRHILDKSPGRWRHPTPASEHHMDHAVRRAPTRQDLD